MYILYLHLLPYWMVGGGDVDISLLCVVFHPVYIYFIW